MSIVIARVSPMIHEVGGQVFSIEESLGGFATLFK
jgi:hypothetical protein